MARYEAYMHFVPHKSKQICRGKRSRMNWIFFIHDDDHVDDVVTWCDRERYFHRDDDSMGYKRKV